MGRLVAVPTVPVWAPGLVTVTVLALPLRLTEKELVFRPAPPCHSSNPASTSISHQLLLVKPRLTMSWVSVPTSRLLTEVVPLVMTYDTVFQTDCWPSQMLYVCPPMLTLLATTEPNGWIGPLWLSQTMSSVPFGCPLVVWVWLNQMS